MPTNISGRLTLIVVVMLLALWAIFPSGHFTQPNLRPGIDMVGGTKLLYQIKSAPGGNRGDDLVAQVMESLKKRVDPNGVKNLVWRPQAGGRLEIQMPLNKNSDQAKGKREEFSKAEQDLEATNLRAGEVDYATKDLTGEARAQRLAVMGKGSDDRAKSLAALSTTWDQIQQAKAKKDAASQAKLEVQYDSLMSSLMASNITPAQLQAILDLKTDQTRQQKLDDLRKQAAGDPRQLAAIDGFIKAYGEYNLVKNSLADASELKTLLKGSGILEFHILPYVFSPGGLRLDDGVSDADVQGMIDRLKSHGPQGQANDILRWYPVDETAMQNFHYPTTMFNEKPYVLVYISPEKSLLHDSKHKWSLEQAGSNSANGPLVVTFSFDAQGSRLFGDLTANNVHKTLSVVLDDKVINAATINGPIYGSCELSGGQDGFSREEANYLVQTLNAGALPAQLNDEPISEETVGPQLGADNLRRGLMASIVGLCVVAAFMIIYYHLSGLIAVIALAMNMILILGVMASLNATWTLPAIAGIVLTIGMSVDANVLVFERLREEMARGLSLKLALANAYDRAFSAIVDSNAVTAITCLILYWIGSEEVKGFGLTLLIGLISSLFTALYVTKTIFALLLEKFDLQTLGSLPTTVPAFGAMLHPQVNWMSKAKYFIAASVIFVAGGIAALFYYAKKGELFDIEFSSGTSVQFVLKDKTDIGEVRKLLQSAPEDQLPSPTVVSVNNDDRTYEAVTTSNDSNKVKQAVLAVLAGRLNITQPSTFDGADANFDDVKDKQVVPVTADTHSLADLTPEALRTNLGGVAVVLTHLNPPLTAAEIKARLDPAQLQTSANASAVQQVDVETPTSGASDTALIIASDPSASYDANDAAKRDQWENSLAKPLWAAVQQAIHAPPQLQKVNNFNPQVAAEMQTNAFIALALSLAVIMVYIWLRFGNFKYGTATVVAMFHDTLGVIGAIGLSHIIGHTSFGRDFLLIQPFRVNLELVAAVLTVMSYSMVDTIVVFDRVRENRGRFGKVSARLINDSINQTLSRTLLTAGTTVMTTFVMYLFGGPGVHGFTFVLLIGILIGTYSSIAIAAPILLVGEAVETSAAARKGAASGPRQLQGA